MTSFKLRPKYWLFRFSHFDRQKRGCQHFHFLFVFAVVQMAVNLTEQTAAVEIRVVFHSVFLSTVLCVCVCVCLCVWEREREREREIERENSAYFVGHCFKLPPTENFVELLKYSNFHRTFYHHQSMLWNSKFLKTTLIWFENIYCLFIGALGTFKDKMHNYLIENWTLNYGGKTSAL